MTWLLKNVGDSDEWKEAGGGRSKKIWKAVHQPWSRGHHWAGRKGA